LEKSLSAKTGSRDLKTLVILSIATSIGAKFKRWATLAGGFVLVGIGAKIAIEHVIKGL
jgi:hypothetical protein